MRDPSRFFYVCLSGICSGIRPSARITGTARGTMRAPHHRGPLLASYTTSATTHSKLAIKTGFYGRWAVPPTFEAWTVNFDCRVV